MSSDPAIVMILAPFTAAKIREAEEWLPYSQELRISKPSEYLLLHPASFSYHPLYISKCGEMLEFIIMFSKERY